MNETVTEVLTDRSAWSSDFTSRLAVLAQAHRQKIELVLATALYLGFACYLTWPLAINLSHSIYGAPGDPYGGISLYGTLVSHHYNPFLPGTISQFAAPEGQPIAWPHNLAAAPSITLLYLLTTLFGAIPAFGLYTLAGYTLTGVVTFLFARRLTANTWAALIAGWAFAFYPFAAINGQGHYDFVHGWVLMLAVWRIAELMWFPTRRNGLLAGLAVVLGMWWSPYFILFLGVTYVVATATVLAISWFKGSLRAALRPQLIAGLIILVFVMFLGYLSTVSVGEALGVRTHDLRELNVYGARPLEYLLPDVQSPVFGGATSKYLNSIRQHVGAIENTLYVGVTIILLSLVAFVAFARRRLTPRLGRAVLMLSLIAVVAAITSMQPEPHIFGSAIPFPSHFITQVTSTWRVYERFVIIVMLALSVLAAVGLEVLTRNRSSWVKIGIMSFATIAIPLDLWAPQRGHVEKIPSHGIYEVLAHQPPGLVAEYPLAAFSFNTYTDMLYQSAYGKPIINGYLEGSFQELRAFSLSNLASPSTAPRLATLGVRYVLVDSSPPTWGWPESGKPGAGFRLIAHEPYADLYLVTAHPTTDALAMTGNGFVPVQLTNTGSVTALEKPSGAIELLGACGTCNGTLSMSLASYNGQPRTVTILDNHGHTLRQTVVAGPTPVTIPIRFSKSTILKVTATPGPQPVSEAPESPSVSIVVINPEFIDARGQ